MAAPGGSTAATMLARKGHDVVLFERERFPREHIGESLLPASLPVLEALGVREAVERAGFLKKWGATMVWGRSQEPWSWYFRETNRRYPHSYQVWRPEFDSLLLDNTRRHGVEVCEGHRVTDVSVRRGAGLGGSSGTRGRVRAVGVRRLHRGRQRAGGADRAGPELAPLGSVFPQHGGVRILRRARSASIPPTRPTSWSSPIRAAGSGPFPCTPAWPASAPSSTAMSRPSGCRGGGLAEFLMAEMAMAPKTASLLRQARLVKGPISIRDWSYLSDSVVGDGFVLVGDAACFVDPLFSSGVHLALSAGVLGAAYVTTALKDAKLAAAAGPVFQDLYYTQYERFHEMAKLFYSSNRTTESYFWEARRILGESGEVYTPGRTSSVPSPANRRRAMSGLCWPRASCPEGSSRVSGGSRRRAWRRGRAGSRQAATPSCEPSRGLAPDARILPAGPVLGSDEFEWGWALTSATRPEGSSAASSSPICCGVWTGGARSISWSGRSAPATALTSRPKIKENVLFAVRTLYVEGAIDDLTGL